MRGLSRYCADAHAGTPAPICGTYCRVAPFKGAVAATPGALATFTRLPRMG